MRRAWLGLGALVAGLALAAALGAHGPRVGRPAAAPAAAAPGRATLAVAVAGGRVTPEGVSVPKDHTVALAVTNRGARAVDLALAGYEDRVRVAGLAPGATWRTEFVSDLPGEDFAWLVDGRPAGRLAVTGSHLVEGHR